jgi:phospholipid/cholesterol/gamma-HCH transport system ATP-binding protein
MATKTESTPPRKTGNGQPAPAKGLSRAKTSAPDGPPPITVKDLTMAFGNFVLMKDLNFTVNNGDIFIIMGGSGSGKSTLLRHMLGLIEPAKGEVLYGDFNFTKAEPHERETMLRKFGVLYQSGALWSSMTLAENVGLPLEEFSDLSPAEIREVSALKLALVGLKGFEGYYPSQISGGMQKRAGLARAIALDPEILFFDEPSAGLDPISSRLLDDLILELRDFLGATVVVVTHELASIFAIGNNSIFLDAESRTMIAKGDPKELLAKCTDHRVRTFLTRGQEDGKKQNAEKSDAEKSEGSHG